MPTGVWRPLNIGCESGPQNCSILKTKFWPPLPTFYTSNQEGLFQGGNLALQRKIRHIGLDQWAAPGIVKGFTVVVGDSQFGRQVNMLRPMLPAVDPMDVHGVHILHIVDLCGGAVCAVSAPGRR